MKNKKFLTIVICLFMIIFGLVACATSTVNATDSNNNYNGNMFTKVESGFDDFYVVYDNETKVMYAVSHGGAFNKYNYGNLTMLVNADGTPKLYEGE